MALTSMKRSSANEAPADLEKPEYPWGLSITLEKEDMDKLGMAMPKVGDEVHIVAKAKVSSTNMSEGEDGTYASVGLQLTDMATPGRSEGGPVRR